MVSAGIVRCGLSVARMRQEGNGMHDSGCGHDVVNGTMSVLEQRQNVLVLDKHDRVAQNELTNRRSIASRNDKVLTRMYSSPNHPPEPISEDAYTRDSNIHAIRGHGFSNRSGQTYPEISSSCQEAQPPLHDSSRFLPPPNNQRLPESPLPLEKCDVAPLLRPLHPENVTQVRNKGSIGLPSAHNLLKLPEHGSHEQTGPSEAEQTFDSLIGIVLNHPMFPLIFKGVCETTTGKTPVIKNKASKVLLQRTVEKVEEHETLCRKIGWLNAQRFMNGVDLFFTVFNAAFKSLQSDERPPIPGPLHATIRASGQCERAKDADLIKEFASHFNCESTDTYAKRARPSDAARRRLENWFNENYKNPYPTPEQKQQLADECGIAMEQVRTFRFMVLKSHADVILAD